MIGDAVGLVIGDVVGLMVGDAVGTEMQCSKQPAGTERSWTISPTLVVIVVTLDLFVIAPAQVVYVTQ